MRNPVCKKCDDSGTVGFWWWKRLCPECEGKTIEYLREKHGYPTCPPVPPPKWEWSETKIYAPKHVNRLPRISSN
jgi:hypothetical protein